VTFERDGRRPFGIKKGGEIRHAKKSRIGSKKTITWEKYTREEKRTPMGGDLETGADRVAKKRGYVRGRGGKVHNRGLERSEEKEPNFLRTKINTRNRDLGGPSV